MVGSSSIIFNLHYIASSAWRYRYLIVLPTIILPIIGLVIGLTSARQWQTHTTILVQESSKINPFLQDWSVTTNLKERFAALDTLLHSRHVLLEVATDLELLSENPTDAEKDSLVAELSPSLAVKLIGKDLVKLVYTTQNVDNIAEILEAVSQKFLQNLLAPEVTSMQESEVFLEQQLFQRKQQLQAAEKKLSDFKRLHSSELPGLFDASNNRLAEMKKSLEQHKTLLAGAKAAKLSIRIKLAQVDPVVTRLEETMVGVKNELVVLRSRYTDGHSKIQAALRQLKQLEYERSLRAQNTSKLTDKDLERLWEIAGVSNLNTENNEASPLLISQLKALQSAESRVVQFSEEIKSIQRQITRMQSSIADFGEVERNLVALQRDLSVQQNLYTDLLTRAEKARVTSALGRFEQPQRIKIIDKPYRPSRPINLPAFLFVIGGLLGGLGVGCGLAMAAHLMDTSVRRRDSVERLTQTTVICRIPPLNLVK